MIMQVRAKAPRGTCPEHGVVTMAVPWAYPESRFTKDFDMTVAWMVKALSKSAVAQYMRVSWATVGRCLSRAMDELEPDRKKRLAGLKRIGIDETSYSKGHRYITTVVNHDTNTVVWVHESHGKAIIDEFFKELTEEQRAGIEVVSGDGARWITDAVKEWCPQSRRCTDPFHVVAWATNALDSIRRDSWQRARQKLKEVEKSIGKQKRGKPAADNEGAQELKNAREAVKRIKNAKYALGKAPEHLTSNQEARLESIQVNDKVLDRAYRLKETLRVILKIKDPEAAKEQLKHWTMWADRCRIKEFRDLSKKIKRHKEYILNFIETGISNARVEGNNNKISLLVHRAFGFRNYQNMVDMIMLICSNLHIPLPNRPSGT
jgi:transposase